MDNKNNSSKQIYVSYAWKVEDQIKIVDKLEQACKDRGLTLLRDKNELKYKESIRDYMDKLAAGNAIILVLSEAYFKSAYCMYELSTAYQREDFHQRIFPLVILGTSFHKGTERTPYIRYWEKEKEELNKELDTVDTENMGSSSHEELKEYGENCRVIDDLLSILGNMNTLTQDIHVESDFKILLDQIQPVQQQSDSNKPKRNRQSDHQFRQTIVDNIRNIINKQTNLNEALKSKISEDDSEIKSLADFLCVQAFEIAIDDYLYMATKQCLSDLEVDSSDFQKTWQAAKTILSWLSLLVVRNEWVEDQETQINKDDFSFTVQVNTATGIEVASARFRQLEPKLEAMTGRSEVGGQDAILPPKSNLGWGKEMPVKSLLIEIWNKVFPEDKRQVMIDELSINELGNLDYALSTREQRKTHHYYIPIPKGQTIAKKILKLLPSITIIYLASSSTEATLRVDNEGRFTSVIREFLTMNEN